MLSKISYDELLLDDWSNIPLRDRSEAIQRAFRAGRYCAEYALCESGGEPVLYQTDEDDLIEFFFMNFIEPFDHAGTNDCRPSEQMLTLDQSLYWERIQRADMIAFDPRIKSFCKGWLKFVTVEKRQRDDQALEALTANFHRDLLEYFLRKAYLNKSMTVEIIFEDGKRFVI